MIPRKMVETVMGTVVLIVAGVFIYTAYTSANIRTPAGYEVDARFFKLGGLPVGSDVRISGIKVGSVTRRHLDRDTFDAVITMSVAADLRLPADTVAVVASEGPLGGKYVRLEPGEAKEIIAPGGVITETRSYRSLEDQVGEIIFLATAKPGEPR
jgi:phospholipid/cholesterol/gamma-HCH transport system substrate-binding protein